MDGTRYTDLEGASVFITGGGGGIGAALTEGFARQGARVAFVDRRDASDLAAQVSKRTGTEVLYLPCDITDTPALEAVMDQTAEVHGPIRVMINNAADDMRMDSLAVTEAMWDANLAVNLRAYFFGCRKAALRMAAGGSIINYSSITYMMGGAGYAPYVAANAGIMGLTRSLAREWGPRGIRVSAIAPGWGPDRASAAALGDGGGTSRPYRPPMPQGGDRPRGHGGTDAVPGLGREPDGHRAGAGGRCGRRGDGMNRTARIYCPSPALHRAPGPLRDICS